MSVAPVDKDTGLGFVFPFILPLIATTVALGLYYWHTQSQRLAKYGNLIPGPPTLPFIGNAHYVIGKNHNGESSVVKGYLPIYLRNSMNKNEVCVINSW